MVTSTFSSNMSVDMLKCFEIVNILVKYPNPGIFFKAYDSSGCVTSPKIMILMPILISAAANTDKSSKADPGMAVEVM